MFEHMEEQDNLKEQQDHSLISELSNLKLALKKAELNSDWAGKNSIDFKKNGINKALQALVESLLAKLFKRIEEKDSELTITREEEIIKKMKSVIKSNGEIDPILASHILSNQNREEINNAIVSNFPGLKETFGGIPWFSRLLEKAA